ncbi:GIY-YIG nuclease family protein [Terrarubrum flagellatum]|uniref:GIY-YIG nuclease family protein n=1 Tax=Terrirubrum flagellatum TaxID=2895980 RepID=UPI003144E58A
MMRDFAVYIMATRKGGPIYIGVTNDLVRRIHEHKSGEDRGFTWKYNIHRLVYYETFGRADDAILREKQLKRWRRAWKDALIEKDNPDWRDLADELTP